VKGFFFFREEEQNLMAYGGKSVYTVSRHAGTSSGGPWTGGSKARSSKQPTYPEAALGPEQSIHGDGPLQAACD
jgi:hypothetical protein